MQKGTGKTGRAMRAILLAATLMPMAGVLSGCQDDPPLQATACSGNSCTSPSPANDPAAPAPVTPICPAALDFSTTYTGGSGSGEYIKVSFDTKASRYRMTFVASSIPTSAGQVNASRAGLTIEGDFTHPVSLPTAEQNRCAFILQNGRTADGSYAITTNPADPPLLFVGDGTIIGGVPGATIQYSGLQPIPGIIIGAIPSRSFDTFPFIGFSQTETDFSQIAGRYHVVGMHLTPTGSPNQTTFPQGWEPDAINWTQTFNADGSCTAEGIDYSCHTTGTPWTLRQNADGSQDNVFISRPVSANSPYPYVGQVSPLVLLRPSQAVGILIVGKVQGQRIPVIVRVGYSHSDPVNLLASIVDDQIGMSLLAPAMALQVNAFDGSFLGVSSAPACGLVTNNGPSTNLAGSNGLNDMIDHPELSGTYSGGFFHVSVGNCSDGTAVATPAANYVAGLFKAADGTLGGVAATTALPTLSLDYAQTVPGKVAVTALRAFNAQGTSGAVPLFQTGSKGVMIRNGPVQVLLMNPNKFNPLLQLGVALP